MGLVCLYVLGEEVQRGEEAGGHLLCSLVHLASWAQLAAPGSQLPLLPSLPPSLTLPSSLLPPFFSSSFFNSKIIN